MSARGSRILMAVIALSALASVLFGLRSHGSYLLLRSAYEAGRPQLSSLRAWMTLDHVAAAYRVPLNELIPRLGLPADTSRDESLRAIADKRGTSRFDFVREVQRTLGQSVPTPDSTQSSGGLTDRILSALLIYGYPALALTLLLGAIGLPLPIGIAAVLAGSLAALGNLRWEWAGVIAVMASFAGDMIAFGIGRAVSDKFLARHGRWIGYTPQRRDEIQSLLQRWGGITVIVSRTLTSSLSSVVSIFAGVSRYRFAHFLGFALVGRLIWTSAYLGLGFWIGSNIEAASQFLGNLSGLVIALGIFIVAGAYRIGIAQAEPR
ncbi:MAG: DedA family protein [Pseudolabrys sp.]|nr:DedA family protein [Pseudolabrys sp.]MSP32952.1 DedA family protein [Pseudolabrys sp.]